MMAGRGLRKKLWPLAWAAGTLLYLGIMLVLGANDFGRVHREYREAGQRLLPERVEEEARRELIALCQRQGELRGQRAAADSCLAQPAAEIKARAAEVAERLTEARKRAGRKLVLFYVSFLFFFLLLPPGLLYLLALCLRRMLSAVTAGKGGPGKPIS